MPNARPPLSRQQLEKILGLDPGASNAELMRISIRLLTRLERRRERAHSDERVALDREIEDLTASLVIWAQSGAFGGVGAEKPPSRPSAAATARLSSSIARERLFVGVIVVLAATVVGLFFGWLSDDVRRTDRADRRVEVEPAQLIVESRPRDAELRIRRPDSEELIAKIPAGGAYVDLDPGRYAIEVSREDCPDSWSLEIELESAESRRYEATVCKGTGELVVRSNVNGDRLRIDELDLGQTRAEPHLLGVGDHRVRVDKQGYRPFEGMIRIAPGETRELRAELVAETVASGTASESSSVPLPFEVVPPTEPPSQPRAGRLQSGTSSGSDGSSSRSAKAGGNMRQAFVPEPVRVDPVDFEPLEVSPPALDFDSPGELKGLPRGGSTTWHDGVSSRFLRNFDADRSGRIDRASETEAIPCAFWKTVERSFDEGRLGLSMSRLYGFDGSEWHPRALGFAREQRGLAYERMKACGLAP